MKTVTVTLAGSRMNGSPLCVSFPCLTRWALVAGCSLLSIAVLGATESKAPAKSAPAAQVQSSDNHPQALQAGEELMHDAGPEAQSEATVAAALLPAVAAPEEQVIWMEVTAYCPCPKCCGPHAQGLTASGKPISYNGGHFVAADKKLFKFGTKFRIPGYADGQVVEVTDRGGAIKGYHLDVFFPTHEQAKQWGRKWIAVTVVE